LQVRTAGLWTWGAQVPAHGSGRCGPQPLMPWLGVYLNESEVTHLMVDIF